MRPPMPAPVGAKRALEWSDVDFKRRMIAVQRSSSRWNRYRRGDLTPELAEGWRRSSAAARPSSASWIKAPSGSVPSDPVGRPAGRSVYARCAPQGRRAPGRRGSDLAVRNRRRVRGRFVSSGSVAGVSRSDRFIAGTLVSCTTKHQRLAERPREIEVVVRRS